MSHHRFHSSAPFGVKVLSFVVAADGLLALFRAAGLLWQGALLLALVVGLVGAMHVALAYGLWQLEPYAYGLGLAVFGLGAALDLLTGNVFDAVLSFTTITMLYHYRGLYRR